MLLISHYTPACGTGDLQICDRVNMQAAARSIAMNGRLRREAAGVDNGSELRRGRIKGLPGADKFFKY